MDNVTPEVEKEISQVAEAFLATCDGHPFAVNKAALQLVRDYMIQQEVASSLSPPPTSRV